MSPRSASSNGAARIAVVGAPTVDGFHLREALAERGVPGARVDLYGTTRGEVVLSDYAGEARMIQESDVDDVARHELIFVCEPGDVASRLAAAAPASVIIDLHGSLAGDTKRFTVPHPVALVLAEVLKPLHRELGLAEATAVVLRPAADFGQQGVEELRDQTVSLLNFAQVPVSTFGRQLAFNIVPEALLAAGQLGLEGRINREVPQLLGWSGGRVAVKLLAAPIFHGHCLQLHFRLAREASVGQVRTALEGDGLFASPAVEAPTTPLEVTEEERTGLSGLSADGTGAYWLWVVAGETAARGARRAVQLAATLFDL